MELSWKEYLKLHAPMIALGLFTAIGAVYTFGFSEGKRAMLVAAFESGNEAMTGRAGEVLKNG